MRLPYILAILSLGACASGDSDTGTYDDDPFAVWERALVGPIVTACDLPGLDRNAVLIELRSQEGTDRLVFAAPAEYAEVLQNGYPLGDSGSVGDGITRVVGELSNPAFNQLCGAGGFDFPHSGSDAYEAISGDISLNLRREGQRVIGGLEAVNIDLYDSDAGEVVHTIDAMTLGAFDVSATP